MKSAYGFIETRGLIAAIEAADAMLKAAKVKLVKRQKIGSALVTVVIEGELGACQAAVHAGSEAAQRVGDLVCAHVIPRPFDDTQHLVMDTLDESPSPPFSESPAPPSSPSPLKVPQPPAKKDQASESLESWMTASKDGVTLEQIRTFLKKDAAETRRLLKQWMDEGKIEKVQQKYFYLSGGKH